SGNRFANESTKTMKQRLKIRGLLLTGALGLLLAPCAGAAAMRPRPSGGLPWNGAAGASGSVPWNIVVLLTLLTLLPSLLLAMTPFARLLVVFHFLRQALGTQTAPSNQTLIGLSLFLTYFIMQPVVLEVYKVAAIPLRQGTLNALQAVEIGANPLRRFMLKF